VGDIAALSGIAMSGETDQERSDLNSSVFAVEQVEEAESRIWRRKK
jgi:hypothetical protein